MDKILSFNRVLFDTLIPVCPYYRISIISESTNTSTTTTNTTFIVCMKGKITKNVKINLEERYYYIDYASYFAIVFIANS